MMHGSQLQELRSTVDGLEAALEDSWGLPSWFYADARVHDLDLQAIFRREWQYLAPAEQMSDAGDVLTGNAGDVPVVVTRADDGKLYGFVNVCRHRGYKVADGSMKNCRRLVCRYHAWSYWLNGDLAAAPGSEEDPTFPQDDLGLLPVSVEQWGDGVFVNVDPEAKPFLETYPELARSTAAGGVGLQIGGYHFVREAVHDVASNWKLWYDNFAECYHCDNIHRGSFAAAYEANATSVDQRFNSRFFTSSYAPKKRATGTGLRADKYRSANIFPGFLYLQQADLMILSQMRPTGPETTRQVVHYFAEDGSDPELVEAWIDLWEQTFTEDGDATAIQQVGLRVGILERNRLLYVRERPVLFFNKLIVDAYKRYFDGEPVSPAVAAE